MSHGAAGLLATALFSVVGWVLTGFVPALRGLPGIQRWGYGYLLGVAWICVLLYGLSHWFGVDLWLPTVLAVAMVPLFAAIVLAVRGRTLRREVRSSFFSRIRERPWSLWVPCLLAVALGTLTSAALLEDSLGFPASDWDVRMTWAMQARWIWAAGTVDPSVLREEKWFVSHPQYPVLMPLAQVAAMDIFGAADDDRVARPIYAAFFPALLVILYAQAKRWLGRRTAFWVLLVAINIPLLAFDGEGGALSGYSDLPLACFYGAGLFLLLARPGLPEGLAAGLLLAAAVLTKNEGLPLALAAVCLGRWSALVVYRRQRKVRLLVSTLAAALLVTTACGFLHSWRSQIPNREDESYFSHLNTRQLAADLVPHAKIVAPLALDRMLSRERWALFWPLALALGVLGLQGLRRPPALRLAVLAAAPMAVGLLAYTVHEDPTYLVQVTWDRMLLHAILPLLLLLGFCLRSVLRAASEPRNKGNRAGRPAGPVPPLCRRRVYFSSNTHGSAPVSG